MLPTDARAYNLSVVSDMLAEQLHAARLPSNVTDQVFPLIDLIQHHARNLAGRITGAAESAIDRCEAFHGPNVIPFRRH